MRGLGGPASSKGSSLELRRGEILGLAGLVGAGRTELAQAIFGVHPPDGGEILIDGRGRQVRSPQAAMERGVFYVPEERTVQGLILAVLHKEQHHPQHPGPHLALRLRAALRAPDGRPLRERALHPGSRPSDPVARLSGGNQQKVVVAKSLAREPSVLLLDEPTRGIDVGAKSEIYRLIDDLAKQGMAILLISSELEEVLSMSDRILVMREGRISGEFGRGEATQEERDDRGYRRQRPGRASRRRGTR